MYDENKDSAVLSKACLSDCDIITEDLPPAIEPIKPSDSKKNNQTSYTVSKKVNHLNPIKAKWAFIQRPDDVIIDPNQPVDFHRIDVDCIPLDKAHDQCTATYDNFDVNGDYFLSFYVQDEYDAISVPQTLTITQDKGQPVIPVVFNSANQELSFRDVTVEGKHYQAILKFNQGHFYLKTASPAPMTFEPPALFDLITNTLKIPEANVDGKLFQATLKHKGNFVFTLESVSAK